MYVFITEMRKIIPKDSLLPLLVWSTILSNFALGAEIE